MASLGEGRLLLLAPGNPSGVGPNFTSPSQLTEDANQMAAGHNILGALDQLFSTFLMLDPLIQFWVFVCGHTGMWADMFQRPLEICVIP